MAVPIVPFLEECFLLEDGTFIRLEPFQKRLLEYAFTPDADDRLPFQTVVWSQPKKSGKTACAAAIAFWFAFGGISARNDEILIVANDLEQAQSRVFARLRMAVEQHPAIRNSCTSIQQSLIELQNGTTIRAIASDFAGAAGSNHSLVLFDELWGVRSEAGRRLYDELTPVPTRKNSIRVVTSYAGWIGESKLLYDLYQQGQAGDLVWPDLPGRVNADAGLFSFWDHEHRMSWQRGKRGEKYYREQRETLRPREFLRLHKNEWSSSETGLDIVEWDAAVALGRDRGHTAPPTPSKTIHLGIGIDASYKKDRTAVVTAFKRGGLTYLGPRKFWQPSPDGTFDPAMIEQYVLTLAEQYLVSQVYYDPNQFHATAMRLRQRGIPMHEYSPQSKMKSRQLGVRLTDLLRYHQLVLYPDAALRDEALMVQLREEVDGIQIYKRNKEHKIDSIVALAMACLAADGLPDTEMNWRDAVMIL